MNGEQRLGVNGNGNGSVSESLRGTASIVDPNTNIVIPHGLPRTPEPGEIQVQPRNVDHDVVRHAVHTEGAAEFTVQVDPAPGSSQSFEFGWLWTPAELSLLLLPEIASQATGTAESGNITVAAPAGVEEGDLLVALVSTGRGPGSASIGGFTLVENESLSDITASLLYKVATDAEPSNYSVAPGASRSVCRILRIVNAHQVAPIADSGSVSASNSDPTHPSLSVPGRGLAVSAFANGTSSGTNTVPTNWTLLGHLVSAGTNPGRHTQAYREFDGVSETGTFAYTGTGGSNSRAIVAAVIRG